MNKRFTTKFLYKHILESKAEASGEIVSYGLWEGVSPRCGFADFT